MSDFGDRMKRYEKASEQVLPENLPILLRLDGNNFSGLTEKYFERPFDSDFEKCMDEAAKSVMQYCSGSEVAYVQSDEFTILLRNDQKNETEPFLGNRTQKLASLNAAVASNSFNDTADKLGYDFNNNAIFDCRCFVIPKSEVVNNFIWRQEDAFKNCISSFAYYGLKDKYNDVKVRDILHGKSTDERQEIIFQKLNVNPNNITIYRKRGRCIYKEKRKVNVKEVLDSETYKNLIDEGHIEKGEKTIDSNWIIDDKVPRFTKDRSYISKFLE